MGRCTEHLTNSERALLTTIWGAKNKTADHSTLRNSVRLTPRGLQMVLSRMADRSLLAPVMNHGGLTITFKGMQLLGVTAKASA